MISVSPSPWGKRLPYPLHLHQYKPGFLGTSFVLGLDREDLAQELRIAIVKAAEGFDEDNNPYEDLAKLDIKWRNTYATLQPYLI